MAAKYDQAIAIAQNPEVFNFYHVLAVAARIRPPLKELQVIGVTLEFEPLVRRLVTPGVHRPIAYPIIFRLRSAKSTKERGGTAGENGQGAPRGLAGHSPDGQELLARPGIRARPITALDPTAFSEFPDGRR